MKLGFLGTGTITSAMIAGLHAAGGRHSILVSPRNPAVAAGLARQFKEVSVAGSNQDVVDGCDTVMVAVRPQIAQEVVRELHFRADQHVISVVSGYSIRKLGGLVAPATRICRAVPLPLAERRESPTGIYPRDPIATALFSEIGAAFEVDSETQFDALCVATATMASYFAFADCVTSWLARHEIPAQQARDYMANVFAGLADTALRAPERSFETLAVEHATRGGTNEQIRNHITRDGAFQSLTEALDGVMVRVTAASRE